MGCNAFDKHDSERKVLGITACKVKNASIFCCLIKVLSQSSQTDCNSNAYYSSKRDILGVMLFCLRKLFFLDKIYLKLVKRLKIRNKVQFKFVSNFLLQAKI